MPSMPDVASALHSVLTTTTDETAQQTGLIQRHRTVQSPKTSRLTPAQRVSINLTRAGTGPI